MTPDELPVFPEDELDSYTGYECHANDEETIMSEKGNGQQWPLQKKGYSNL